jgi:hypothetical protein
MGIFACFLLAAFAMIIIIISIIQRRHKCPSMRIAASFKAIVNIGVPVVKDVCGKFVPYDEDDDVPMHYLTTSEGSIALGGEILHTNYEHTVFEDDDHAKAYVDSSSGVKYMCTAVLLHGRTSVQSVKPEDFDPSSLKVFNQIASLSSVDSIDLAWGKLSAGSLGATTEYRRMAFSPDLAETACAMLMVRQKQLVHFVRISSDLVQGTNPRMTRAIRMLNTLKLTHMIVQQVHDDKNSTHAFLFDGSVNRAALLELKPQPQPQPRPQPMSLPQPGMVYVLGHDQPMRMEDFMVRMQMEDARLRCGWCAKTFKTTAEFKWCKRCRKVGYCDSGCQHKAWKKHKKICKKC